MANAFPTQTVPAPARVRASFGLFDLPGLFRESPDTHWEGGGVQWLSLDGGDALGVIGRLQSGDHQTDGITKTFPALDEDVDTAGVFTVYGATKISPAGYRNGDEFAQGIASTKLTSLEERAVEAALSGVVAGLTPSFSTLPSLGSLSDWADIIATAEQHLADEYGAKGVIHLGRASAVYAFKADVLEVRGGAIYTKLGTPVVAGQGYPNTKAFVTSSLVAYRSDIFPREGVPYDLLDKDNNDLYAIAERTYCIGFEAAASAAITITEDSPA